MKNNFLQNKLDNYADCLETKRDLLFGAYAEMDRQSYAKKRTQSRLRPVWIASAAILVVALVCLFALAVLDKNETPPPLSYSLSGLNKSRVDADFVHGIQGVLSLNLDSELYVADYLVYQNDNGEIYVTAARYRTLRNGGLDEIVVHCDLLGALSGFDWQPLTNKIDTPAMKADIFKDGEYFSYIYMKSEVAAYYITIMSPNTGAGLYFKPLLF